MAERGGFAPDERLELIGGVLYSMSPASSRHASAVKHLTREFYRLLGDRVVVSVQDPLQLSDLTLVEPDIALLSYRDDLYSAEHPIATDALLVVEVSLSTLAHDQNLKLPHYAAAGVRELWIVDLEHARVDVYRQPREGAYTQHLTLAPGASVAPLAFHDARVVPLRAS